MKDIRHYLPSFVYGGIDGGITTFAVVAGSVGANMASEIILVLGFANLFADGLSMSVGAYLSGKSDYDLMQKELRRVGYDYDIFPDERVQKLENRFKEFHFSEKIIAFLIKELADDKKAFMSVMTDIKDDLITEADPRAKGIVTFISFMLVGILPLITYVADVAFDVDINHFLMASVLTGLGFVFIGYLKSYITEMSRLEGIVETVLLGSVAASAAYFVGVVLEPLVH